MHRDLGIETELVPGNEWRQRFPWLEADGVGAIVFERESGYADPIRTTEAFVEAFVRAGGEYRPRTPVRALTRDGDRITGIMLDEEELEAGAVINAAGALGEAPRGECRARPAPPGGSRAGRGLGGAREPAASGDAGRERGRRGLHAPDGRAAVAARARISKALPRCRPVQLQGDVRQRLRHGRLRALVPAAPRPLRARRSSTDTPRSTTLLPTGSRSWDRARGSTDTSMLRGGAATPSRPDPSSPAELADWVVDGTVRDDYRRFSHDRIADGALFTQSFRREPGVTRGTGQGIGTSASGAWSA